MEAAGVPGLQPYTFRHLMATKAMTVPADIKPDREQREEDRRGADQRGDTAGEQIRDVDHLLTRSARGCRADPAV